jgi:molecular chaperone GrpE (heat shock protein)
MSGKQKRVIELQFECEELGKIKKRLQGELEETQNRSNREREGQREMQGRLESLISEV